MLAHCKYIVSFVLLLTLKMSRGPVKCVVFNLNNVPLILYFSTNSRSACVSPPIVCSSIIIKQQ